MLIPMRISVLTAFRVCGPRSLAHLLCVVDFLQVHRYLLGRDSSAFQHMFSMPADGLSGPQNMEGCTDKNPIRLYGESVERFRALLSVIYDLYVSLTHFRLTPSPTYLRSALTSAGLPGTHIWHAPPTPNRPQQLQAYTTPAADVPRLLTIAEMTNKYHFATTEAWAADALYSVVSGRYGAPHPQHAPASCPSAWLRRLLELALLCGHAPLREHVVDRWVERIRRGELRPVHALEIADRAGIRRLQGCAYYHQLLEMGDGFDPGVIEDGLEYARCSSRLGDTATALAANGHITAHANVNVNAHSTNDGNTTKRGTPAVLSPAQKRRLLSGHWSLTRLWTSIRTQPPAFPRTDGCTYHQHGCLRTWASVWAEVGKTEATLRAPGADVLERLRAMEAQLGGHADLSCALTPQCKRMAMRAVRALVEDVREGLADRFVDLGGGEGEEGGGGAGAGVVSMQS